MLLNACGKTAASELLRLPDHFPNVEIDRYVVMPNHIHCIIEIDNAFTPLQTERSRPFPTIPVILGLYKSGIARKLHIYRPEIIVWQKSYYDHIIRNEQEYLEIAEYIENNPLKWELDQFYVNEQRYDGTTK